MALVLALALVPTTALAVEDAPPAVAPPQVAAPDAPPANEPPAPPKLPDSPKAPDLPPPPKAPDAPKQPDDPGAPTDPKDPGCVKDCEEPTCEELGNCPPPPTCEELGNCPEGPCVENCEPPADPPGPLPEDRTPGGGAPRPAALPFTGPGDMFLAFVVSTIALMGGALLYMQASVRDAVMATAQRAARKVTGFGIAQQELEHGTAERRSIWHRLLRR